MTRQESVGLLRRLLGALGSALKRGILGKSAHAYTKQFTGGDAYWDSARGGQLGSPLNRSPIPNPGCVPALSEAVPWPGPGAQDNGRGPPESEEEPVHGWTRRQLKDYLARNPGYRATY